jgi:hypothetical protein
MTKPSSSTGKTVSVLRGSISTFTTVDFDVCGECGVSEAVV